MIWACLALCFTFTLLACVVASAAHRRAEHAQASVQALRMYLASVGTGGQPR